MISSSDSTIVTTRIEKNTKVKGAEKSISSSILV